MLVIKEVKRKGNLMVLTIEDTEQVESTIISGAETQVPLSFQVEIDAEISRRELWNHVQAGHRSLMAVQQPLQDDAELEKRWKGETWTLPGLRVRASRS